MQNPNRDDCGDIKPNRNINMLFSSLLQASKERLISIKINKLKFFNIISKVSAIYSFFIVKFFIQLFIEVWSVTFAANVPPIGGFAANGKKSFH